MGWMGGVDEWGGWVGWMSGVDEWGGWVGWMGGVDGWGGSLDGWIVTVHTCSS